MGSSDAFAVFVDRRARDEIHHEPGLAVGSGAAVQQLGDVGVFKMGQNAALGFEASHGVTRIQAAADNFQRHQLAIKVVHAHGLVNHAHAAFADDLYNAVRADVRAGAKRRIGIGTGDGLRQHRRGFDEVARVFQRRKQRANFFDQFRMATAYLREEFLTVRGLDFGCGIEDVFHAPPGLRTHDFVISR